MRWIYFSFGHIFAGAVDVSQCMENQLYISHDVFHAFFSDLNTCFTMATKDKLPPNQRNVDTIYEFVMLFFSWQLNKYWHCNFWGDAHMVNAGLLLSKTQQIVKHGEVGKFPRHVNLAILQIVCHHFLQMYITVYISKMTNLLYGSWQTKRMDYGKLKLSTMAN